MRTEDSLFQKTFVQRYDKDKKVCYFWNAKDPEDIDYYLKLQNLTKKGCHTVQYTQIYKSNQGLVSYVSEQGDIVIYYMKRFYKIKAPDIPSDGFMQISAKLETPDQAFPLNLMINPTGCFALGDCEFVYNITIHSTKSEIQKELLMHDTKELKKYLDIKWSYCTFLNMKILPEEPSKIHYICYILSKVSTSDPEANQKVYETNIFLRSSNGDKHYEYKRQGKIRDGNHLISFARNPDGFEDIVWFDNDEKVIYYCQIDNNYIPLHSKHYNSNCRNKKVDIPTSGTQVLQYIRHFKGLILFLVVHRKTSVPDSMYVSTMSQRINFPSEYFKKLFEKDVLIDISNDERLVYYTLDVNKRFYQSSNQKFINYGTIKPTLVLEISKEDFTNKQIPEKRSTSVIVTLKDNETTDGVKITNEVTLHESFNPSKVGQTNSRGDKLKYQFRIMDQSLKNEDMWQTPIICEGDYLEYQPHESSEYVVTLLPFTNEMNHYPKNFDQKLNRDTKSEFYSYSKQISDINDDVQTWYKIKTALVGVTMHKLNLKLRFSIKNGFIDFLKIIERDTESAPKCSYSIDLINYGIPGDIAWRTGEANTNQDPGVKGYELIFADDFNKEFWVFSFNYLYLTNTYAIRRVNLPQKIKIQWWNNWLEYVRYAKFDINLCYVNIIPKVKKPIQMVGFNMRVKDVCTNEQHVIDMTIHSIQNTNFGSLAVKKKIELTEKNISNFQFDFYQHFTKVGHMPMDQNKFIAMNNQMKDFFTLQVDDEIEIYPSEFIVGGMVHILKSSNFRYESYEHIEPDNSSLIVYGLDRQNLIYKVIKEGKDMGEVYSSKYSRVRKIDFSKDKTGFNLLVLRDTPTDSFDRQILSFKTKNNSFEYSGNMLDVLLMPKRKQEFSSSKFNDLALVIKSNGDLSVIQFDFDFVGAGRMTILPLITAREGKREFQEQVVVKSMDSELITTKQVEIPIEVYLTIVASDSYKANYADKINTRHQSVGYWINFIAHHYDDNEAPLFDIVRDQSITELLLQEEINAVTYVKSRFNPKTKLLEILIDTDKPYLYLIEVDVENNVAGNKVTIYLNKNLKMKKYIKPHIFSHFTCEFSKNFILCQSSSFTWDGKKNVSIIGWNRYKDTEPISSSSSSTNYEIIEKEGIYPYKLKNVLRVNPLMTVALENYQEDIITYLRCQPNKTYARIETNKLTEKLQIWVDVPASVKKPYDLTFSMQFNPWVDMGSKIQILKTEDWIKLAKPKQKDNTKLKNIIFAVVFGMLLLTFFILSFVICKVVRKKSGDDFERSLTRSLAGADLGDDVYKSFASNEESVYSQISTMLEKAQNKRKENMTRDQRRQRRKILREKNRMLETGSRESGDTSQDENDK